MNNSNEISEVVVAFKCRDERQYEIAKIMQEPANRGGRHQRRFVSATDDIIRFKINHNY